MLMKYFSEANLFGIMSFVSRQMVKFILIILNYCIAVPNAFI